MYIVLLLLNLCNVLSASGNLPINSTREANFFSENNRLIQINNALIEENNLLRYYVNQLAQKCNFIENENKNLKSLTSFNNEQTEQLRQEYNQLLNNFLEKNQSSKSSSRQSRTDNSQERSNSKSNSEQTINNFFTAIHKKRMQEKLYAKK